MIRLFRPVAVAVACLAVGVTPAWAADASWGKIRSTNPEKNQFVVLESGDKERLYTLTDDAKVMHDGKEAKLGDIKTGDPVIVLHVTIKDNLYACGLTAQPKDVAHTMKGKVKRSDVGKEFVLTSAEGKDALLTLTDDYYVDKNIKGGVTKTLKEGADVVVHYVTINKGLYAFAVEPQMK